MKNNRLVRSLAISFIAVVAVLSLVGCATMPGASPSKSAGTIEVSGTAVVKVSPDIARFSVGVSHRAATSAEAQDTVIEKMSRVLELLKNAGIQDKDIVTTALELGPEYEWRENQRIEVGQKATQRVSVVYRLSADDDGPGGLLAALGRIDEIELSSIRFAREDEDEALSQARAQAVANAYAKAADYAQAAGVGVGRVLSLSETDVSSGFLVRESAAFKSAMPLMATADSYSPVELPTGEIEISATVYVIYSLQ